MKENKGTINMSGAQSGRLLMGSKSNVPKSIISQGGPNPKTIYVIDMAISEKRLIKLIQREMELENLRKRRHSMRFV